MECLARSAVPNRHGRVDHEVGMPPEHPPMVMTTGMPGRYAGDGSFGTPPDELGGRGQVQRRAETDNAAALTKITGGDDRTGLTSAGNATPVKTMQRC